LENRRTNEGSNPWDNVDESQTNKRLLTNRLPSEKQEQHPQILPPAGKIVAGRFDHQQCGTLAVRPLEQAKADLPHWRRRTEFTQRRSRLRALGAGT
jgi:hypothetical protein